MSSPLFLLVNDDGVHAPGIRALRHALKDLGEIVICAPHVERSATSHAISIALPLRVEQLDDNIFAVEGTPADCVMLAIRKLLKRRPDYVVSGINRGANLGLDTLYSGTVGAAMEGCLHGIPAIAVSLHGHGKMDYRVAGEMTRKLFDFPDFLKIAKDNVLNINVPNVEKEKIAGFAITKLGRRRYEEEMLHRVDPRGREYYWIGGGGQEFFRDSGSDCEKIERNFITVTALQPELIDHDLNAKLVVGLPKGLERFVGLGGDDGS